MTIIKVKLRNAQWPQMLEMGGWSSALERQTSLDFSVSGPWFQHVMSVMNHMQTGFLWVFFVRSLLFRCGFLEFKMWVGIVECGFLKFEMWVGRVEKGIYIYIYSSNGQFSAGTKTVPQDELKRIAAYKVCGSFFFRSSFEYGPSFFFLFPHFLG